jgi:sulfur carrier protein
MTLKMAKHELMQILLNGKDHQLTSEIAVAELLASLQIDPKEVAIEWNLKVLSKDLYASTRLKDGDRLEIVRFVGGG